MSSSPNVPPYFSAYNPSIPNPSNTDNSSVTVSYLQSKYLTASQVLTLLNGYYRLDSSQTLTEPFTNLLSLIPTDNGESLGGVSNYWFNLFVENLYANREVIMSINLTENPIFQQNTSVQSNVNTGVVFSINDGDITNSLSNITVVSNVMTITSIAHTFSSGTTVTITGTSSDIFNDTSLYIASTTVSTITGSYTASNVNLTTSGTLTLTVFNFVGYDGTTGEYKNITRLVQQPTSDTTFGDSTGTASLFKLLVDAIDVNQTGLSIVIAPVDGNATGVLIEQPVQCDANMAMGMGTTFTTPNATIQTATVNGQMTYKGAANYQYIVYIDNGMAIEFDETSLLGLNMGNYYYDPLNTLSNAASSPDYDFDTFTIPFTANYTMSVAAWTCGGGDGQFAITITNPAGPTIVFNQIYDTGGGNCTNGFLPIFVPSTYCIEGYTVQFQSNENNTSTYPSSVTDTSHDNNRTKLMITVVA